MIYRIEANIFESFPCFCRGVVILFEADNSEVNKTSLEEFFRERIREIESDPKISIEHKRVKSWTEIYKTFPIKDAHRIRPSVAALIKRIKQGSQIPFISPLVCISNLISLSYIVPSGLIDIDKVEGDLFLDFADGSEKFQPIGDDKIINPVPNEIIYYDTGSKNVMCRAWNSRGGKATLILPSTKNAVIDVDGLTDVISEYEIEKATAHAAELVSKFCNAKVKTYLLNKENPIIEF